MGGSGERATEDGGVEGVVRKSGVMGVLGRSVLRSNSAPGLSNPLFPLDELKVLGVSGRRRVARLPVLERRLRSFFRLSLNSGVLRGFLGGSYKRSAFDGIGGASGEIGNPS